MERFMWFDLVTLGLILILAIKGIVNGFIKEVFGLIGIVGGIYMAARYATKAGDWIDVNLFAFNNKSTLFLVGFLAILIVFWIFCIFLGAIFTKMLSLSGLGIIDKLAGFIVGGSKIFFVFAVLFFAISNVVFIKEKLDKYLNNSFMYPAFIKTGAFIVDMKPEIIKKTINITTTDDNESKPTKLSIKVDQNNSAIEANWPKPDSNNSIK